jgi:hypothetical protein
MLVVGCANFLMALGTVAIADISDIGFDIPKNGRISEPRVAA